jgi:hypothetical protein
MTGAMTSATRLARAKVMAREQPMDSLFVARSLTLVPLAEVALYMHLGAQLMLGAAHARKLGHQYWRDER